MIRRRLATFAATSALAAAGFASAQDPVFKSVLEAVRVDTLVTSGNELITGLSARDFEVFDNGVPQRVDLVSFEELPLNVILAFDMSDSVAGERLEQLQRASGALLSGLRPGDQSALITFSHEVRLAAPLSADVNRVKSALGHTAGSGGTSLGDGVYAGVMLGESDPGRALVIVFSDGVDTTSWLTSEQVLDTAKRSDAVIYGVSVRAKVKPELLNDLTAATGGRLQEIERIQNLSKVFVDILNEFRTRYLISYTPAGVTRDGWHRLDVRVKGRRATVHARPGYLAGS